MNLNRVKKTQKSCLKKNKVFNRKKCILGFFFLKSKEPAIVTKRQLEVGRRVLTKRLKRHIKIIIVTRLNKAVTAKTQGIRMGKGKGALSQRVGIIRKNTSSYTLGLTTLNVAKKNLFSLSKRLPFKAKISWKGF